jgi:ribosomal protein L37AE/L43A
MSHTCPFCHESVLTYIPADLPWSSSYWVCDKCDSTYNDCVGVPVFPEEDEYDLPEM